MVLALTIFTVLAALIAWAVGNVRFPEEMAGRFDEI